MILYGQQKLAEVQGGDIPEMRTEAPYVGAHEEDQTDQNGHI